MKWHFSHSDVSINSETYKAHSSTTVTIEHQGVQMTICMSNPEEHVVGTRKALVDSGNLLRSVGLEMLRKAEKIN